MWPRSEEGKALHSANIKPPRYNGDSLISKEVIQVSGSGKGKPIKPKKTKGK